jgi:S-DNA-T family DNA segregation ATPase FtsK/SpoIIIE
MGDQVAADALQDLYDLRDEMERRGKVMKAKRAASAREAGLHPILAIFDEIHRGFQHRELGKDMAFIGEDVIKQARKYGIIVVFATQSPTATSIPKGVTREVICRVAFSVIDQVGNDALLGDGNYKRGVRATELRPGSPEYPGDRGTSLTVGVVGGKDWSMVRGHFVTLDDAVGVVERGRDLLTRGGNGLPATEVADPDAGPDPLADIGAVLGGEQRMRTQEVLQGLTEYDRGTYGRWTFADLTAVLTKHQAAPYKSGGNMVVRADLVHAAIAKRDTERAADSANGGGDD